MGTVLFLLWRTRWVFGKVVLTQVCCEISFMRVHRGLVSFFLSLEDKIFELQLISPNLHQLSSLIVNICAALL